jgi:hypothetical protein
VLAGDQITLSLLCPLHRPIGDSHELGPAPQGVQRSALDERFENALVHQPQIHLLAKLPKGSKAAFLLRHRSARGENRIDGVAAHILDGGEAEANACGAGGEVGTGNLHVGWLDGNSHLTAFLDVLDYVFRLGNL